MKSSIITVEIADPDFGDLVREMARYKLTGESNSRMFAITSYWSDKRWPNQIMRVHKYNSNLPALIPANRNRPYV